MMKLCNKVLCNKTQFIVVFFIVTLTFCIVGCGLTENIDKLQNVKGVTGTTSFNGNILDASMSVKDALKDIKMGNNSVDTLRGDTLGFKYQFSQNFDIGTINFPNFPMGVPKTFNEASIVATYAVASNNSDIVFEDYSSSIVLDKLPSIGTASFTSNFVINEITLKQGATISIQVPTNTIGTNLLLDVEFPTIKLNGVSLKTNATILANSTANINLNLPSLNGYVLTTQKVGSVFTVPINLKLHITKLSSSYNPTANTISLLPMLNIGTNYSTVKGFFGKFSIQNIDFEENLNFSLNQLQGKATIEKINLKLTAAPTGLNVPIGLNFAGTQLVTQSNVVHQMQKLPNAGNDILFKENQLSNNSLELSNKTYDFVPDVDDILHLKTLHVKAAVTLNEGNETNQVSNELSAGATLNLKFEAQIPISLQTQNLQLVQIDKNTFNNSDMDKLENTELKLGGSIVSKIPLGCNAQIYFRNTETGANEYQLFDNAIVIPAAKSATAPGESVINISINKEKLDKIKTYKFMVFIVGIEGNGTLTNSQTIRATIFVAGKTTFKTN